MKYIITVDIGTTSVKTGVFDRDLNEMGFVSLEYKLLTPKNDYVEMEPGNYWDTIVAAIRSLVKKAKLNKDDVSAIAVCSQGETLIPVDINGQALRNAIVWIDSRAKEEAEYLSQSIGNKTYYETTGLSGFGPADPVCKLLWIKNNEPQIYAKTHKFLLLTDYIAFLLSGKIASEWTMMSSTGYYDINKNQVCDALLEKLSISRSLIPDVNRSGAIVGGLTPKSANELGLRENTNIIISANDQMCAAVGGGNIAPGTVTETTGTALVIAATVDKPDYPNGQGIVYYKHVNEKYMMVPYVNTASIILKWFKDEFCDGEIKKCIEEGKNIYDYLGELANSVEPLSNGLMLYPQFAGKNSPDLDPNTKGVFFNVGLETNKAHFIRAIFEGVAYMLKENIQALERTGIQISEVRSLGGGSKSDIWNQIKADVLNKPISTLKSEESTSLGTAIMAAVAMGWYADLKIAVNSVVSYRKTYLPNKDNVEKYEKAYLFYLELDRTFKRLFSEKYYI